MLSYLVKGMQEAGADVETVHLREKTIRNCVGCFTCWTKTPGKCIHKDDMSKELYPKWLASDLAVYATPLYHFHMNAAMKAFIERTLPVLEPFLVEGQQGTSHPLRDRHPLLVFLSVAGFPEAEIFDQLSAWVNSVYGRAGAVVAEIYRPAAETMVTRPYQAIANDVLEATLAAGREIVESMKISPATMARIKQDIVEDNKILHQMGNMFWKTCIEAGVTPKEFEQKGLVPRPDSIDTFMLVLPMGFNADAARDLNAIMQFNFSGQVEGSCHFKIKEGKISARDGAAQHADITINSPFEIWMDIMTGKADGQKLFVEQKYTVDGNLELLLKMNALFGT
jgi:putative sterol carrier protein